MGDGSPVAGCGCFLAAALLIAGGVMYSVCQDAVENNICGGNERIENAGLIMMIVGGALMGIDLLCCCCLVGVIACDCDDKP
ncbi:hypothetical protein [Sicyoidochytrium minutum DNA virus]|nr:hypothetical protein [Sicyoidochytrium minutum DNA virus]